MVKWSIIDAFGASVPGSNPGGAINHIAKQYDINFSSGIRTWGTQGESRAKGLLVFKDKNKKVLLRDGGAITLLLVVSWW